MAAQEVVRIERRAIPSYQLPDSLHPVLRGVLAARGIVTPAQLEQSLTRLARPDTLHGIDQAAQRLAEAVIQQQHIVVVGDFDADGATGVVLALRALSAMGATHVSYRVPNRFEFGYGLSPGLLAAIMPDSPDLLLTVDNGIASVAGVAAARAAGVAVIVTDHHLPGPELPAADAIVNPNLPGDTFPSKHLAGVGVMFYVMSAVRNALQGRGWFDGRRRPELAEYLDLVALGTVADVVKLDANNRILVAQGLARIRAGRCSPGIRALLDVAGRDLRRCTAADLAFAVAPRLNAAGRLEDMAVGIECLLSTQLELARKIAYRLDEINRERRRLQGAMQADASRILARLDSSGQANADAAAVCLFDPDWHQGIVGLIASRVAEKLHRPAIAFAPVSVGADELKGSARSIDGYHIRDALADIAAHNTELIQRFGGHAAAAGLSLHRTRLDTFRMAFAAHADALLDPGHRSARILTDGPLAPEDLELGLADAISQAGPWGHAFEEPLFEGRFVVVDRSVVGEHHVRLRLRHQEGGDAVAAIAFNTAIERVPLPGHELDALCHLDVNEYRGRRDVQLRIRRLLSAP